MIKSKFLRFSFLSIAIVMALWLPFGFALTGILEEWGILGIYNTYGLIFVADTSGPWSSLALRPLTMLPQSVAYLLDHNSFKYWHILLMLSLIIKGAASSHLVWKATNSMWCGMVMGLLVLAYPADTMQLSFRGIHIDWALALLLLGSSVFIVAYEHKHSFISYGLGVVAALFLFAAICMYEATLLLAPLPLLILYAKDGFKEFFNQFRVRLMLATIWLAGAGIYIAYAIVTAPKIASYQASLGGGNTLATLYTALPKLFSIGALRSLLGGWFDAARIVGTEFSNYSYLVIATMVIAVLAFVIARSSIKFEAKDFNESKSKSFLPQRLALVGLILLLLGYIPFLLSPPHMAISQRTFLCATLGSAMVWVALLMMISRYTKVLTGLLALGLIFIGLGAQLFQFHHYSKISETQNKLLKSIVENFDGNLGDKTLLILDESNQLNHTWMFLTGNLQGALTYIYGHPISAIEVCHMPSQEWQYADDLGRKGLCVENASEWSLRPPEAVSGPGYIAKPLIKDKVLTKGKVIAITIKPDGSIASSPSLDRYRKELIYGESTLAKRYQGVLAKTSWLFKPMMFNDQIPQESYRWDFGSWWSLELPTRGSGWREAEWEVGNFHHKASAWKTQKKATLYFDFSPSYKKYTLRGKFDVIVNPAIEQSIRISVNNSDLNYKWVSDRVFEAEIQPDTLRLGVNNIEFNSDLDSAYYGLSVKLDWFEIKPRHNLPE